MVANRSSNIARMSPDGGGSTRAGRASGSAVCTTLITMSNTRPTCWSSRCTVQPGQVETAVSEPTDTAAARSTAASVAIRDW